MWRCGKYALRAKRYHGKRVQYEVGDSYFKDENVDADLYVWLLENQLKPRIKELRERYWDAINGTTDYTITIQHDGAPGHRAVGIEEHLDDLFREVGGVVERQPAKSPCTNILDLCVFHSLSARVAQVDYRTKTQLHAAVDVAFAQLDPEVLEMQWAVKATLMHRLVEMGGGHIPITHEGLRVARGRGGPAGRVRLWKAVDAHNARAFY